MVFQVSTQSLAFSIMVSISSEVLITFMIRIYDMALTNISTYDIGPF